MYYGYYGYFDWTYILVIIATIITLLAQCLVNSRYKRYKGVKASKGMTGRDVARMILDANDLKDIEVHEVAGSLTDHYDPTKRVVNLSTDIYKDSTVAGVAVAAHECGHAIQDKVGYSFLKIRHGLVPTVNLCSKLGYIVIGIGLLFGSANLAMAGLILLGMILVFQLVTLPVEFNASSRALKELERLNITDNSDHKGAKRMLTAAALTYVAGVASTLLQLLRLFIIIVGNSRRND